MHMYSMCTSVTAKGCHRVFRINVQHQALTKNANTLNYSLSQYTDSVLLLHAYQLQEIIGVGFVPDLDRGPCLSGGARPTLLQSGTGGAQAPPIYPRLSCVLDLYTM